MNQPSQQTHLDISSLGTDPIPVRPYVKQDYFELEQEAVFKRTWLQLAHVCELPEAGSYITRRLDVANASLLISRSSDGTLRAFYNVCPHRGTELVNNSHGKSATFTCPYHAWSFSHDGQLRGAPDFERFYIDKDVCGLRQVALDVCAGLIFINLQKNPKQTLRDFLGPLAEQLETLSIAKATQFSEYIYEVDANWKLTYDNFQENYHLRFIHPRSGAAAGGPSNPFGYPERYGFQGSHRTQTIWSNPEPDIKPMQGACFGKAVEAMVEDGLESGPYNNEYYALFPNLFINASPLTPFVHTVMPISATRSRGIIRLYWIGADNSASRRFTREFQMATALDVHAEDINVIEASQRGLNSGALSVIHFQQQEVLCRHLLHQVNLHIDAYQSEQQLDATRQGEEQ